MSNKILRRLSLALFSLVLALGASSSAFGAATIVILNNDPAGVGFNDTTVVAPVGGNTGTTLGQQRLIAFQAAAATWGATLTSSTTITIRAQWIPLTCTGTSAVLGSAGAVQIWRDFGGAPFTSTWYNESLTGKLDGVDPDPATPEINARFNINLGNAGCLTGTFFYLGLDNNHGTNVDLVTVLEHEFAHGLGFQTFTSGTTGALLAGFPSVYDRFLIDDSTGMSWLNMTNAERVTSALNTHKLAWDGPQVTTDMPAVLTGTPELIINSPPVIAGRYDVGTAAFGPALTAGGVTGNLLLANDGVGTVTDGCEVFPAGFFTGQVALIDRGTCTFTIKVKNAQNAGAIAVIIADNAPGSPPAGLGGSDPTITIPSVRVTQADGITIKAQLGTGVNGTLNLDMTLRSGADPLGKALLFAPNPFQSGSSVSHWDDIAFPNQLMEPAINGDLTHNVTPPTDLTFSELSDVGWVASSLPSSIATSAGNPQGTLVGTPFATALQVTVTPALKGVIVTFTAPATLASGTFTNTGTRTTTAVTNVFGRATASGFTANAQAGSYTVNATAPGAGTTGFALSNTSPSAANGSVYGTITDSSGAGISGVTINLNGSESRATITDVSGHYSFDNVETNGFYTVTPSRANYTFSPQNRSFSLLGSQTEASFTASANSGNNLNPLDGTEYFVRQQYLDFLGREPDPDGFAFWSNEISSCGSDQACVDKKRVNVSAAFFLSIEFQQTGYEVYRIYKAAYGNLPGAPVPLKLGEFKPDTQEISNGVIVNQTGWQTTLEANKQAFVSEFVQRARFVSAYPTTMTPAEFVDKLFSNAGVTPGDADRSVGIGEFGSAATSSDVAARGRALRRVAENSVLAQQEFNQAFVLMQYFGYLRRDPNAGPDVDFGGYNFWLSKLDQFDGNFERAEMVKAFIYSGEYRGRFPR